MKRKVMVPMSLLKLKLEWNFQAVIKNKLKNIQRSWYFMFNEIDTKLVITNLLLNDIGRLFILPLFSFRFFSFFSFLFRFEFCVCSCLSAENLCIRLLYNVNRIAHTKCFLSCIFFFLLLWRFKYVKYGTWWTGDHHSISRNSCICAIRCCRWYALCVTWTFKEMTS